ncbi:restriction endonuclease subunit S [Candidatus Woesearchaeota archaeon]|nr:restriction endonuclease subunit S [Candidatus Woesearchaeota archaeon]
MTQQKLKQTEIGMIPQDWRVFSLDETTEINKESRDPSNKPETPFFYIDIESVENESGNIKNVKRLIGKEAPSRARRVVHENDVIMSTVRPYLKAFAIVEKKYENQICSTGFAVLTSKDKIHPKYLLYSLFTKGVINQCTKMMTGGQYPALNSSQVARINIPLPPILEQKKISEVLSTVDTRLDIVERESQRVERLKVGLMKELFDGKKWPSVLLGDEKFFEMIMGQSPPSELYNRDGIGLPFLQGNAEFGDLHPSPTIYCSKPLKVAKEGDILISVRAPVGEVNMANTDCCIGRGVGAIRAKDGVDSQFLFFYLKSVNSKLDSISGGSTFKAITKNQLEKLEVFLPPITEQKKISLMLSTIDKKLSIQKSKKSKLESIKKSLMNDLLTGKKRVKVTQ